MKKILHTVFFLYIASIAYADSHGGAQLAIESFAIDQGISESEASYHIKNQVDIGGLADFIERYDKNIYAGMYIDYKPFYKVTIAYKKDDKNFQDVIESYVSKKRNYSVYTQTCLSDSNGFRP